MTEVTTMRPRWIAGGRLAEGGENQGIGAVNTGRLQVVGGGVRRNALEQELAKVGVLALVAIERDVEQPEPDRRGPQHDEGDRQPDPDADPHGRIR